MQWNGPLETNFRGEPTATGGEIVCGSLAMQVQCGQAPELQVDCSQAAHAFDNGHVCTCDSFIASPCFGCATGCHMDIGVTCD